jgi:hypothetical protein
VPSPSLRCSSSPGGLAASCVEERHRQGRSTAVEIAWHPLVALPLDGSASSRELCAGTFSAGKAQAIVRLASSRRHKDGGRGGLARTEPVEYSSAHTRRPSCGKKLWACSNGRMRGHHDRTVPIDIVAAVRWLISLLLTKSSILAAKLTYALSNHPPSVQIDLFCSD